VYWRQHIRTVLLVLLLKPNNSFISSLLSLFLIFASHSKINEDTKYCFLISVCSHHHSTYISLCLHQKCAYLLVLNNDYTTGIGRAPTLIIIVTVFYEAEKKTYTQYLKKANIFSTISPTNVDQSSSKLAEKSVYPS